MNQLIISVYGSHNAAVSMYYNGKYYVVEVERWANIKNSGLLYYNAIRTPQIVFDEITGASALSAYGSGGSVKAPVCLVIIFGNPLTTAVAPITAPVETDKNFLLSIIKIKNSLKLYVDRITKLNT